MRRSLTPLLAVCLTALLAACGTTTDGGTGPAGPASASTAADPVDAIRQGLGRSLEKTAKMDVTIKAGEQTITMRSAIEPATGAMMLDMTTPDPVSMVLTADALYLKQDESDGKPWVKLDRKRLRPDGPLAQGLDVRAQAGILGGVESAESAGDGRYTGVADADKAVAAASTEGERTTLRTAFKVLKNKSVPFEATLDPEGRLTRLTYTFDTAAGAIENEMTMHSFGEPVRITAPKASDTEDASAEMYRFF
ncbi:hypothetical protein [Micromonospora sp. WMMD998]|uniref:hypothetical protein n=1 Tax=Micromonospora sp. WMMD998 TaxID=3016092 RepID=UPI00249BA1DF|nr:hypothetical protein [Micromonospora sp. WMMD998]WFE40165.1 hypothetical protein O7619_17645 [Micromonospora sp. WMMD998]